MSLAGKANLRILPTPVVSFTDVTVGGQSGPTVEIERFRAEVELAALLKGEIHIIQMTVERPLLRADLGELAAEDPGRLVSEAGPAPERVSLARLEIVDGRAELTDRGAGRTWRAEGIRALVEATSLRGPGRIDAELTLNDRPLVIAAAIGSFDPNAGLPAKISVSSAPYPVLLTADGNVSWGEGAPPRYSGTITLAGTPPDADSDAPPSPWAELRAQGAFELTEAALSVTDGQLSYGGLERPLILQGGGRVELRDQPRFEVAIEARQIDLDRILGGSTEQPVAIGITFERLLAILPELPRPAIPGVLHLDAQGIAVGGNVLQAVGIDLTTSEAGWRIDTLAAVLPGETRLDVAGDLTLGDAPAFAGHGRIESSRPAALAGWLHGEVGLAAALDSFAVEADFDFRESRQVLANIVAAMAGGEVRGTLDLQQFGSGHAFAEANLTAERADLVEARALAGLLAGRLMLPGSLDAAQVSLSLNADVLTVAGVEARSVVVEGSLQDGRLDIGTLSVADLAGASIEARGNLADPFGNRTGRIDASVKAENISGAAEFLAGLFPDNAPVARFRQAAAILSPVTAEISAEFSGPGEPLSLDLTGSFADTHVNISASGQGSLQAPETLSGKLEVHIVGDDSAAVLTQFGLEPLPVRAGPLRLDATLSGPPASSGSVAVDATLAGVEIDYSATATLQDGAVAVAGEFRAESADIDPALLMFGLAVPGLGEGHEAAASGRLEIGPNAAALTLGKASFDGDVVGGIIRAEFGEGLKLSGDLALPNLSLPLLVGVATGSAPEWNEGRWSEAAFAPALPADLALDFDLRAAAADLGLPVSAGQASLRVQLGGGKLNVAIGEAELAGGTLKGSATVEVVDGEAAVGLSGVLREAELHALVWQREGLPVASGRAEASFELSGRGRSMAGVVSTLAGSGSFAVENGQIDGLNPQALADLMAAADTDAPPDEDALSRKFAGAFEAGGIAFERAAGSFSASGGLLAVPTVSITTDTATILADATLDLNTLDLASGWSVRARNSGAAGQGEPQVNVLFSGPLPAPERQVDSEPLLDLFRSRHLQRQLDKIEALEEERGQAEARRQPPPLMDGAEPLPDATVPDGGQIGPPMRQIQGEGGAVTPAPGLFEQAGEALRDALGAGASSSGL